MTTQPHSDQIRAARAAYVKAKRHRASLRRQAWPGPGLYTVAGIKHGDTGYREHSCRCNQCKAGKWLALRRPRSPQLADLGAGR